MLVAAKNAEEKAKKAMVDAASLADELRAEQDHATNLAGAKNSLNNQLGELEGRLADAENAALKGGKAAMAKLEGKTRRDFLPSRNGARSCRFSQGAPGESLEVKLASPMTSQTSTGSGTQRSSWCRR